MKKLLLFLALAAAGLQSWADDFYIVGNATNDDWKPSGRSDAYKMTKDPSLNKYTWTGFLKSTNGDLFKICIGPSTWEAWCAGSGDKEITISIGETETFTDDGVKKNAHDGYGWNTDDNKWKVKVTGYYTLTLDLDANPKTLTANLLVPADDKDNCSISTSAHLKNFASLVNDKGLLSLNAKLKDDIDMTGESSSYVPIGTSTYKYAGTFDGGGYRIKNLTISSGTAELGLFSVCANATINNLIIDSSCSITSTNNSKWGNAAFVARCDDGTLTFKNCGNEANVSGGTGNNAAFIGKKYDSGLVSFENCYNTGNISGGGYNAAFIGENNTQNYTMVNCYNSGTITRTDSGTDVWVHSGGSGSTVTNCYTTTETVTGNVGSLTKGITTAQVASGELCYLLNADQNSINWYQTISTDTHPQLTNESQVVKKVNTSYTNLEVVSDKVQIGTVAQLEKFAKEVNAGNATLNAELTDDIATYSGTHIGNTSSTAFCGVFDGKGYKITINYNKNESKISLFRCVTGGTIQNLLIDGTINAQSSHLMGGLVNESRGSSTYRNIVVGVNMTTSHHGDNDTNADGTHGGVVSVAWDVPTVENVAFVGSINAPKNYGTCGIIGYAHTGGSITYRNCYVTGTLTLAGTNNRVFGRNGEYCVDCYTTLDMTKLNDDDHFNGGKVTSAEVTSGKLCHLLNGDQSSIKWYQTLAGTDSYPYPFDTHKQVYQVSSTSYTNLPVDGSGNVQISDADDLKTFSAEVNAGNPSLNAELTADIDMSGESYTPIGTSTYKYVGTFDGNSHFVKLNINTENDTRVGFIAYAKNGANIKNLLIKGSVTGKSYVAGIVGSISGTGDVTFENCGNEANITASDGVNAGGIFGCNFDGGLHVLMKNCFNSGNITGNQSGQLTGWSTNTEILNCYTMGETSPAANGDNGCHPFARLGSGTNTITDCYSDQNLTWSGHPTYVTAADIASGKFCYQLNEDQGDIVWYQNIGSEDNHPVPFSTRSQVNQANTGSFTNLAVSDSKAQIGSADDLIQFSKEVNVGGNTATNAVLTDDIDLTSEGTGWWPIGYGSNKYAGTFDGDKHEITFSVDYGESSSYAHQAMFGMVTNGASISNLIVKGKFRANSQVAGIIAYADGNGTVTLNNIMNYADIQATENGGGANASGFVACAAGDIVINATNCANLGTIRSGYNQSGAFAGWINKSATFTNCWNIGEIYNIESGTNQLYRHGEVVIPVNCYDLTEFGSQGDKSLDEDAAVTGELCYKVNNGGSNWYQTLGTDNYPVPFSSSESVLAGQWFNDEDEDDVYYNEDGEGNITVYQLNLDDTKTVYNVPAKVTAKNVKIRTSLSALANDDTTPRWNTFCSPVELPTSYFSQVKKLSGVTENGYNYTLSFTDETADNLVAGKPYMVQVASNVNELTATDVEVIAEPTPDDTFDPLSFHGTFAKRFAPLNSFIISNNAFYRVNTDSDSNGISEVAIKAFRGYISEDPELGDGVKALNYVFEDDADGIESIQNSKFKIQNNEPIYNLAGQRIQKMQKGINIVNGRKVLF